MALAALSLDREMPLELFYNERKYHSTLVTQALTSAFALELIQRLFDIADQLQHRANLMAMDALRNLVVQAFLIDNQKLVDMILGNGFFTLIEQIIRKAIDQLQVESQLVQAQQKNSKDTKQTEHYQLSIEQAYVCLSDVCHFLEHGEVLKGLTQSELVTKTVRLALNCA